MKSKLMVSIFAFAITSTPALCHEKPVQNCKVTFAVVYLDRLNNTNNGIPQSVKDVEKKLSKYGDVCYAGDKKADLLFFIHTTPAVYHGTRVYTNNSTSAAAATDGNGNSAAVNGDRPVAGQRCAHPQDAPRSCPSPTSRRSLTTRS